MEAAWESVRALNRFVEDRAPWTLAKDPARAGELDVVLATLADGVRVVAILLASVMPSSAGAMLHRGRRRRRHVVGARRAGPRCPEGARVEAVGALFPRVDEPIA